MGKKTFIEKLIFWVLGIIWLTSFFIALFFTIFGFKLIAVAILISLILILFLADKKYKRHFGKPDFMEGMVDSFIVSLGTLYSVIFIVKLIEKIGLGS